MTKSAFSKSLRDVSHDDDADADFVVSQKTNAKPNDIENGTVLITLPKNFF